MTPPPTMESPSHPVPPPTKKHRSLGVTAASSSRDRMTDATGDAIARRRAELRRLQQLRAPSTGASSTAAVLARARHELGGGAPPGPPPTRNYQKNSAANVPQRNVARVRSSDIFPNAPKLVDSPSVPAKPMARTLEFQSPMSPESPRFLESTASSRAKSAPPMRPPPPPPLVQANNRGRPPPIHRQETTRTSNRNSDRSRVERPPPTPYYPKQEPQKKNGSKPPQTFHRVAVPGHIAKAQAAVSTTNGIVSNRSVNGTKKETVSTEVPPALVNEPKENQTQQPPLNSLQPETTPLPNQHPTEQLVDDDGKSPITPRRDLLQNLRQCADTPPEEKKENSKTTNDLRLVKELRHETEAKKEALQKVAELEKEIQERENKTKAPLLKELLDIAQRQGGDAALDWAREQVGESEPVQSFSQVGFLSPVNGVAAQSPASGNLGAMSPLAAAHHPVRRRVATPHPKRPSVARKKDQSQNEQEFLVEATKAVPFEYTSALATYIVRRPYESNGGGGVWDDAGVASAEVYASTSHAGKPSSMEILAQIQSDGSVMTLSGVSTVRHKHGHGDGEWKTFPNVDEMGKPLGCVMYIDGDANEKEYWLDAIYEEALATREAYCSSLISTASALQASGSVFKQPLPQQQETVQTARAMERPRPQTVDACVSTDDIKSGVPPKQATPSTPSVQKKVEPKSLPPEQDDSSSDVLSVMIAVLFSSIFSFIWFVIVRLPLKVLKVAIMAFAAGFVLSVLWLYFADDHGAEAMGARIDYEFSPRGML